MKRGAADTAGRETRLAQEFCDRAGVPYLYYTATKGASPVEAITAFLAELSRSGVPVDRGLVPAEPTARWPDAFRLLAAVLPDSPVVIVLDELPWLAEQDEIFDGTLQTAWDRLLSRRPVLVLLLGSDLHMMERLTAYDRPFFGRADNLLLGALSLRAADAIDAYLLSGGLPRPWSSRNLNARTRPLRCSVCLRLHCWQNSRCRASRVG